MLCKKFDQINVDDYLKRDNSIRIVLDSIIDMVAKVNKNDFSNCKSFLPQLDDAFDFYISKLKSQGVHSRVLDEYCHIMINARSSHCDKNGYDGKGCLHSKALKEFTSLP